MQFVIECVHISRSHSLSLPSPNASYPGSFLRARVFSLCSLASFILSRAAFFHLSFENLDFSLCSCTEAKWNVCHRSHNRNAARNQHVQNAIDSEMREENATRTRSPQGKPSTQSKNLFGLCWEFIAFTNTIGYNVCVHAVIYHSIHRVHKNTIQ